MRPETIALLDELAKAGPRVWEVIEKLLPAADSSLVDEIRRRRAAGLLDYSARPFISLLGEMKHLAEAALALRDFLRMPEPDDVAAALRALGPRLGRADGPMLVPFLAHRDRAIRVAAIPAAAMTGDAQLADHIVNSLEAEDSDERMQAAIAIGHLRAVRFADAIAARLPTERGRVFSAFTAALEMLGSREVIPILVDSLRKADADQIWDVTHALWVLAGVDPVVDDGRREPGAQERLRREWLRAYDDGRLARPPAPMVGDLHALGRALVSFSVEFGLGALRFDFDPPTPGTPWPRWERSLYVGGSRVYDVGSTCGTCETLLRLVAWPGEDVATVATQMEISEAPLTPGWVKAWTPLLRQLRSGRYLASLLSLRVERVDEQRARDSWFVGRDRFRGGEEVVEDDAVASRWPGTTHYQGARLENNTYPIVVPSRNLADLDEARVCDFQRRIEQGERPCVVALGWVDEREIQGEWQERFLNLVVLNGHHRLEAYSRTGVPAPIAVFARVADSWGPPETPDQWLLETFGALAGT
ncbi:MAG: hypothetical protein QM765_21105 [Myxococcales bacterium]